MPNSRISVRLSLPSAVLYPLLLQVNIELSVRTCCKNKALHETRQMLDFRHFVAKWLIDKELEGFKHSI